MDIYGGKATIKQNKFGLWLFHMWVSNEKCYYEKSLRTKRRVEAIDKAEKAEALKTVKRLCKEFGFTAGMLKGLQAKGRKKL